MSRTVESSSSKWSRRAFQTCWVVVVMVMRELVLHVHLLLASAPSAVDGVEGPGRDLVKSILEGNAQEVVQKVCKKRVALAVDDPELGTLKNWLGQLGLDDNTLLLFAVALLQTFIQNNYTGPGSSVDSIELFWGPQDAETRSLLHESLVRSLAVLGQQPYELMDDPVYLLTSLLILENLVAQHTQPINSKDTPSLVAVAHWWRARALLTQLSLLATPNGPPATIASTILDSIDIVHAILRDIPDNTDATVQKSLYTIYYLENVKCSLAVNTEHRCLPSLVKAAKLNDFKLVLTGARTKRTKFQQTSHSGLIILAQSSAEALNAQNSHVAKHQQTPESFELNSDLLLEKPFFESIGNEPLDEQIVKKPKIDDETIDEEKLLPVAIRQENIPIELQSLDPNNQPQLSDYDNIQLLLRLYTLRQTSPAKDPLVEEELSALVSRVLYQDGPKNWTIFSRSLWERSIIETTKAKTVERGILQMQSLVEELGLKITTKLIPQDTKDNEEGEAFYRLKYIHQLPFIPRWKLDASLAEKYMSLGILRSAVEIYERLEMPCEAALCFAAIGEEKTAEEILIKRTQENPKDARAFSILGDIRQDPDLWLKSWEIGKYVNAKNSLGRYYYSPPAKSGLQKDYDTALKHLNDSLRQYPISFDTWYFYGCIGLECRKMNLAAEAFSRCTALDPMHAASWSNLSAAYVESGKLKEAFSCLKRAVASDAQNNWRIWENYMIVAAKLDEWNDVLLACQRLLAIKKNKLGEKAIDLPIIEKLVDLLVSTDYVSGDNAEQRLTHFQVSCIDLVCNVLPTVVTTSVRCWKLIAKVELWRKRPWVSLECHEKAYRAILHNPDIEVDEKIWNETVDACEDLVAAYESLGEMDGRHGAGSLVCKDWKYKARSTMKALMSKGKNRWEDSDGWEKLLELRKQV